MLGIQDWLPSLEAQVPAIQTVARGDQAVCGRVQDVLPAILPSEQLRYASPFLSRSADMLCAQRLLFGQAAIGFVW